MDLDLNLGDGLHTRVLAADDAALLVEATNTETARSLWAHHALDATRIWLEINPRNEPSLRLAQRVGYYFEQRLLRHCRDWSTEDAEHDSWHDCLIWTHLSGHTS